MKRLVILAPISLAFSLSLIVSSCSRGGPAALSDADLVKVAFGTQPPPANTSVLDKRRINLDDDPDLETVALLSAGAQERLIFVKGLGAAARTLRSVDFALREPGLYHYDKTKGWTQQTAGKSAASVGKKKAGADDSAPLGKIVRRLLIARVGKKSDPYSVIVEYLTDSATRGRVESHLLVFTGTNQSFNSQTALAAHPLMQKGTRLLYELTANQDLVLFPGDVGYESHLRWNGREMIVWYPGEALFRILPLTVKQTPHGDEYLLEIRNEGGPALIAYVSVSFSDKVLPKPTGRRPARLYRPGSSIHARSGRAMAASNALLELTVRGWRSQYRQGLRFTIADAPKDAFALVRVVTFRGDEKRLTPPENSSVSVATDQQGYTAYAIRLSEANSAGHADKSGNKEEKK